MKCKVKFFDKGYLKVEDDDLNNPNPNWTHIEDKSEATVFKKPMDVIHWAERELSPIQIKNKYGLYLFDIVDANKEGEK